jgi:hypothetical protein
VINVTWDLKWSAKVFNLKVRSEVLTDVVMKCCIFWDVTPCRQQSRALRAVCFVLVFCLAFFLILWTGMRLSPLGTSATSWSIVPAPDVR